MPKSTPARFPEVRSHAGRTTWSDVPGTTVLFTTTAWNPAVAASAAPICSAACCTKDTSMLPSGREGVPTQMKVSSLSATAAARSVVARSRLPRLRWSSGSSPRSKMGGSPRLSAATLRSSMSMHVTVCPSSASPTAVTRPT